MQPESPQSRSFFTDAVRWHQTGSEEFLLHLLRCPLSGVAHDVAAAYATIGRRSGSLLEAIDRERLALPAPDRDTIVRFAQSVRRIRALPPDLEPEALEKAIAETFALVPFGETGPSTTRLRRSAPDDTVGETPLEFQLAEPVSPEEPGGVAAWRSHFSASALNTYAECARKWFYKYACAAVEDPGSAASAYGSAFHQALEDFHADFPRPKAADEVAMRGRIRECITWAFERNRDGFERPVEFQLQVRRAQRTAQRYVNWLLAQERDAPFEVLGREVAAEIDLEGHPFVGYIDRLDRDERSGGIGVVDYKTGNIAASAAEYSEKVRRFRDFQLPFYYWARTAIGDRVTKLVLIPLKDAHLDVRPVVLHVGKNIGVAELERSRARMIELSARLSSGSVRHFEPSRDPAPCEYCAYAVSCAQKPFPEARRFGS